MASLLITGLLGVFVALVVSKGLTWRRAYTSARKTGLPVFLSPVYMYDPWWIMVAPFLLPIFECLPEEWKKPWLPMSQRKLIWKLGHRPFREVGADTFILSSPLGNFLWTCDSKVIHQLSTLHPKVQVATHITKVFDVYGPCLGSVEGDEWKRHRRVFMTGFTPWTNARVWKDTTVQMRAVIGRWQEEDGKVGIMRKWTSRLALHVISAVFFDKSLSWSKNLDAVPNGFKLRYDEAISAVIKNLAPIAVTPRALLGILPFKATKEAHTALIDWTKYMQDLQGDTMERLDELATRKDRTIMESITLAGTVGSTQTGEKPLPRDSILGNLFFAILAGHETTGNTLAFALILLAIYPEYQVRIQKELDKYASTRSKEDWTVEQEYQIFQHGWIGAVLKETLRIYCVVQFVPRHIVEPVTMVESNGNSFTISEKTMCAMNLAASFRNSETWPKRSVTENRRRELHHSPAVDFQPEQWLGSGDIPTAQDDKDEQLLRHLPFGQGAHYCPGRLFAQVELTAALATLFADYSLELIVDGETRQSCDGNEQEAWAIVRDKAIRGLIDDVTANVNIQMMEEIPIRVVKRSAS